MAKKELEPNRLQELKNAIRAKDPDRLYIFHGEETFLLNHYLEQLKKVILDELTESFNFHKLNSENFEIRALADAVENLPMMAERTLVWVDEIDLFKMTESDREKIMEIFSDIPDYCTLVFTYVTVPWKPDARLKKYCDLIKKQATIVEFAKQDQRDLVPWIGRHFAAHKKQISTDLCVYLIDITGGTMTALAGEIAKICAYSGADRIVKSDIDAVVEPVLDAVVFQMTDLMSQGAYGTALVKMQILLKMQEDPIKILGAIGAHFRRLGTARTLLDNGRTSADLMKLAGIGDYPARKTMSAASRFSARFCAKATELVLETDYMMKNSIGDKVRLLETLILQIAQEAKHG